MSGMVRSIKRNIARNRCAKAGLKANRKYCKKTDNTVISGLKMFFEKLFKGGK